VGCTYGEANGLFTVALLGDSHAAQWVPTFQALAERRGWRLLVYTKSSCPLADVTVAQGKDGRPYRACDGWNRNVLREMRRQRPDLVVTSSASYLINEGAGPLGEVEGDSLMVDGLRRSWEELVALGSVVVPIADTPRPGFDMAECVSANEGALRTCAPTRAQALALSGKAVSQAAEGHENYHLVNLNDAVCPDTTCAPVIGRVLVYRDESHLTATYARSLAGAMFARLEEVVDVP
jgi:hypothetical protein